jgi:hypothetical protein
MNENFNIEGRYIQIPIFETPLSLSSFSCMLPHLHTGAVFSRGMDSLLEVEETRSSNQQEQKNEHILDNWSH